MNAVSLIRDTSIRGIEMIVWDIAINRIVCGKIHTSYVFMSKTQMYFLSVDTFF